MPKFLISLKHVHDASGYSRYRVSKDTGIAMNTVKHYVGREDSVVQDYLPSTLLRLCEFYGVNWRDVVDVVEDDGSPEMETPVIDAA